MSNHIDRQWRWRLRVMLCCALAAHGGCVVYVPPLSNMDCEAARALQPGVSTVADVKRAFGRPDGLDTPGFKVYTAHHDYGFLGAAIGGPYGGGSAAADVLKRRDMCIVARFDDQQTLTRLEGVITGQNVEPPVSSAGRHVFSGEQATLAAATPLWFGTLKVSDGGRVIAADDKKRRLWLKVGGREAQIFDHAALLGGTLRAFALSRDGSLLALAGNGVVVIDVQTREPVFDSRQHEGGRQTFTAVALGGREPFVVAGSSSGDLPRWSVASGAALAPLARPPATPQHLVVSADGSHAAAVMSGSVAGIVWNTATGAIETQLPDRAGETGSIAFLDRSGSLVALAHSTHIESHRLDATAPGGSKLQEVTPLPPNSPAPMITGDGAGRLSVRCHYLWLLDPMRRMVLGEAANFTLDDDDQVTIGQTNDVALFGPAGRELLVSTAFGVYAVPVSGAHSLDLAMWLFDR